MRSQLVYRFTAFLEGGITSRDLPNMNAVLDIQRTTLGPCRIDLVTIQYVDEQVVNEHIWRV